MKKLKADNEATTIETIQVFDTFSTVLFWNFDLLSW